RIDRGSAHVTQAALRGAQVTNRVDFRPTRTSYTGAANSRGRVATPPSSATNRAVVARTSPGAAASHIPVRTMDSRGLSAGRVGNGAGSGNANRATNNAGFGNRNETRGTPSTTARPGS